MAVKFDKMSMQKNIPATYFKVPSSCWRESTVKVALNGNRLEGYYSAIDRIFPVYQPHTWKAMMIHSVNF